VNQTAESKKETVRHNDKVIKGSEVFKYTMDRVVGTLHKTRL